MEHDHLNKLSITFQQQDQCEIWWKLAKWFPENHDFIHVNSTVAGKYYKYKPDDGHLRFPIRTILTTVDLKSLRYFQGWCEGVVYLTSLGRPTDIGLQLGKACYPCSG